MEGSCVVTILKAIWTHLVTILNSMENACHSEVMRKRGAQRKIKTMMPTLHVTAAAKKEFVMGCSDIKF